jgi:hypothetical protein
MRVERRIMAPFSSLTLLLFPIVEHDGVIFSPFSHTSEFDYRVTEPQRL